MDDSPLERLAAAVRAYFAEVEPDTYVNAWALCFELMEHDDATSHGVMHTIGYDGPADVSIAMALGLTRGAAKAIEHDIFAGEDDG